MASYALSGLVSLSMAEFPRALPWADEFRPFGPPFADPARCNVSSRPARGDVLHSTARRRRNHSTAQGNALGLGRRLTAALERWRFQVVENANEVGVEAWPDFRQDEGFTVFRAK